jgi:hypothetical protein
MSRQTSLRGVEATTYSCSGCGGERHARGKRCPQDTDADRRFWARMKKLESDFGRGETFSLAERSLVLEGVIPAFVLLGCRTGKTPELVDRSQRAVRYLERLYSDLGNVRKDS